MNAVESRMPSGCCRVARIGRSSKKTACAAITQKAACRSGVWRATTQNA